MGDPVVKRIVDKLYGPDRDSMESVVLRGDQVIVSRETLDTLLGLAEGLAFEYRVGTEAEAAMNEVREVLGDERPSG